MLIKESTIKKILREEFRRVLSEGAPFTAQQVDVAAQSNPNIRGFVNKIRQLSNDLKKLGDEAKALGESTLSSEVQSAITNLEAIKTQGKDHPAAVAVVQGVLTLPATDNSFQKFMSLLVKLATSQAGRLNMQTEYNRYQSAVTKVLINDNYAMSNINKLVEVCSFDLNTQMGVGTTGQPVTGQVVDYDVQPKDTISSILNKLYGIPASKESAGAYKQVATASGISNPDVIKPGQKLKLPAVITIGKQTYNRKS